MALRALGSLLPRALQRHGVAKDVGAARIIEAAEVVLAARWGNVAKEQIKVRYYRDNALYLSCVSSVMAQELKLHEKQVIDAIRSKLNEETKVERIKFVV